MPSRVRSRRDSLLRGSGLYMGGDNGPVCPGDRHRVQYCIWNLSSRVLGGRNRADSLRRMCVSAHIYSIIKSQIRASLMSEQLGSHYQYIDVI